MAKDKLKKHGRNIYFRDPSLWDRLQALAEKNRWSLNQVVEIALTEKYPKQ